MMERNSKRKTSSKGTEPSPKTKEQRIDDKQKEINKNKVSESSASKSSGTPLNSPLCKISNNGKVASSTKEASQSKDRNNNATISEEAAKETGDFFSQMNKKFDRRSSDPGVPRNVEQTPKRFSLIADAIRNPGLRINDDIRFLSEEDGDEEESEQIDEVVIPKKRVNRKTEVEKESVRKSRPLNRGSERKTARESPPMKVDLQSQPEFQILLKELREVKEQLKEKAQHEANSKGGTENNRGESQKEIRPVSIVKSPSEATMYTPAVRCKNPDELQGVVVNRFEELERSLNKEKEDRYSSFQRDLNQYLKNIRFVPNTGDEPVHRRLNFDDQESGSTEGEEAAKTDMKQKAQDRVVQAEKFRADLQAPKGKEPIFVYIENEDDKFLHVICHLEESLRIKIKKGEFVELEKLLPKQTMCGYGEEQNRISLFHKEGETYFAPALERRNKITNIHAWDKAFRVYLAVYTEEFPKRTGEIMQYVQNIHHAASKYKWDNVAYYDFVFRHLMEQFPERSWAKTYTQGWTYAMCEPLTQKSTQENFQNRRDKKTNVCWKFNKGICDYGTKCRYPHRCTYCGAALHGAHACFKKQRKSEGASSQQGGQTVQQQQPKRKAAGPPKLEEQEN